MNSSQREAGMKMLKWLHDTVKTDYYDPRCRGVDLDTRYEQAKEKLANATTLTEIYGLAAWVLEPLDDSHTVFLPPSRPYRVEQGWRMKFVGDRCYLTAVQPGSDAAKQGLKPGDQVIGIEGFRLERDSAWKLHYAFEVLAPRSGLRLNLAPANASPRELLVKARVENLPKIIDLEFDWRDQDELRMTRPQLVELGDSAVICKFPVFDGDIRELERLLTQTSENRALILDLRGNPGGRESMLLELLGKVLDHNVQIAQPVARKSQKPLLVKAAKGRDRFCGKLIVLVDSGTGSAAEIFARVIQLEKRGTVLGDRTSGRVMEAKIEYMNATADLFQLPFGLELTISDVIMADGKSLEHTGVLPDELVLPTVEDLATGRDPVLSRAAHLAGVELTPEKAYNLFPPIWHSFNGEPDKTEPISHP